MTNILKRLFGKQGPPQSEPRAARFDFHRAFQDNVRLCYATSWEEARRIVEGNPQLLSDQGMALVEIMKKKMSETENKPLLLLLDQNRWLFDYCRRYGVEDAFATLSAIPYETLLAETLAQLDKSVNPLTKGISALMAADGPIAYSRVIRDFPILLDKKTEPGLKEAISNQRRFGSGEAADLLQSQLANLKRVAELLQEMADIGSLGDPIRDRVAWARVQKAMGEDVSDEANLGSVVAIQRSVLHLEAALEVFTVAEYPDDWADVHVRLATYSDGLAQLTTEPGDWSAKAIEHYEQALQVYTREACPERWATVQHDLAATLLSRQVGDLSEQIEQGIRHLHQALEALDPKTDPRLWAKVWSSLASAYRGRQRGDQVENIEQAIFCAERSLQVFTREAYPDEWARVMSNLGNAYQSRIKGDRHENATRAVECYEQALEVRTRERNPITWAISHLSLAEALSHVVGSFEANAARAVQHYESALEVITRETQPIRWAQAQSGLAKAILGLGEANLLTNAQRAIHHLEQAMLVYKKDKFPSGWARIQYQLGMVHLAPVWPDRTISQERAIHCLRQALEVFSPQAFPSDVHEIATLLANLLFSQGRWPEAADASSRALAAGDVLFRASLFRDSKEIVAETGGFASRAAYAQARTGNLREAAVLLERGRARLLAEALETERVDRLKEQGYEQEWDDFKYLVLLQRMEMGVTDTLMETDWADKGVAAYNRAMSLEAIRVQMDKAIAAIQPIPGWEDFFRPPTFDRIAATAHVNAPLVYLCATSAGGLGLIVRQENVEPVWLDDLTSDNISSRLIEFMTAHQDRHQHWQAWLDVLETTTRWLWDAAMGPVVQSLIQAVRDTGATPRALLIAGGLLGLLPLHAAWTEDSDAPGGHRYALDKVCFSYVPSARSLNAARSVAERALPDSLLAVTEPRPVNAPSLPNASVEVAAVMRAFSTATTRLLEYEDATFSEALEALPKATVYHFACHGYANFVTPLSSGLLMAEGNLLTVAHLLEEHLPGARLAVLSACETGIPSDLKRPDEVVGLPACFLQAGVAGVVASLWSVADRSTMMLMIRFYDNWRNQQIQPAEALWQAQQWMRRTNDEEKEEYVRFHLGNNAKTSGAAALDRQLGNALEDERATATDFSHPYYWAAFTYTGT